MTTDDQGQPAMPPKRPPQAVGSEFTGYDWEYTEESCPKCGETMVTQCCGPCGGEGTTGPGELYEEDPLWYDPDDYENCHECDGHGSWTWCRECGWDETEKRYMNGKPENATPNESKGTI